MSNKIYTMTSKENEERFQSAYDEWDRAKENNDSESAKDAYNTIWFSIQFACENIAKAIYTKRNVIVPNEDLEEIILDSTLYVMKFINKGIRPDKLSSYCFLRVRRFIDDPKKIWYEKNITQMPQDNYKDIDMEIESDA
mgnify:CR=1 FL=1